jgi:hypothetical protein
MSTDNIEEKLKNDEQQPLGNINADISRIESETDENLDTPAESESAPQFTQPIQQKKSFKERLKVLLRSKKFWVIFTAILLALLIAAWFIQPSRVWFVNLFGQRTDLTITIMSRTEDAKQPEVKLKNAVVKVNERQFKSDEKGQVKINDQPYGRATVNVSKEGYGSTARITTLDFDPFFHLLGGRESDDDAKKLEIVVDSVGIPVQFTAIDWLSGLPIKTGEYTAGDLVVKPDDQGVVSFRAPANDNDKVSIRSNHGGRFTDQDFTIPLDPTQKTSVTFVPASKHYFMSKRDGALGIYTSNIDGSDTALLIPGTGQETLLETRFATSPDQKYGVLVSTRDGVRDKDKNLIARVYVVDLAKKQLYKVDEGRGIYFIDWSGNTLVYRKSDYVDNKSQATLNLLDVAGRKTNELAKFETIVQSYVAFDQAIVWAGLDTNGNGSVESVENKLVRYNLKDKTSRDLSTSVSSLEQTNYDTVVFQVGGTNWQEFNFNTGQQKQSPPPVQTARQYLNITSADGGKRLFIDTIDGRRTLFTKAIADGAEKQIAAFNGLTTPVIWNGDVLTFSVVSTSESADYAVSLQGGLAKKITDVTAGGQPFWYPGI